MFPPATGTFIRYDGIVTWHWDTESVLHVIVAELSPAVPTVALVVFIDAVSTVPKTMFVN